MADKNEKTVIPLNTPSLAVRALAMAEATVGTARLESTAAATAQVSGAASLLMIAELLEQMLSELKQLRGILCTRRPPL